ncbi:Ubiquitin carboxyl-terminal hydrolase 4 [Vanrija pseudolonga]|uniref:ubiquitinyl hydrolase 1 n=1 Tax=Vanrija pseudolonga TaxID=143232 RepID=A0AAF0Y3F2_9TREE|nr:Ubiquitin carboxyl-terminal hydrolase 4 [Vanrija pseudolonga]
MSRSSIPTARAAYDSMSYDQLRVAAADVLPVGDRTPKQWFELALQHAEAARQADRRGSKATLFVEYTQLATAYKNALFHPGTKEAKAADPRWATRVSEFKPTWEAAVQKATTLKEELKRALSEPTSPVPASSRTVGADSHAPAPSPSLDEEAGGSIADRMKALSGRGMDVGSGSKRISRDFVSHSRSASTTSATVGSGGGGASGFGAARNGAASAAATGTSPEPTVSISTGSSSSAMPPPVSTTAHRPTSSVSASSSLARSPPVANGLHVAAQQTGASSHSLKSVATGGSVSSGTVPTSASIPVIRPSSPTKQPSPVADPSPRPQLSSFPSSSSTKGLLDSTPLTSPPKIPAALPHRPSSPSGPRPLPSPAPRGLSPVPSVSPVPRDDLGDFEANFPSLDNFGKQFEDALPSVPSLGLSDTTPAPASASSTKSPVLDDLPSFPDLPAFPTLPSVPSHLPGREEPKSALPPPPAPADSLHDVEAFPSPPSPDLYVDLKRPASTPIVSDKGILASSPPDESPLGEAPASVAPPAPAASMPDPVIKMPEPRTAGPAMSPSTPSSSAPDAAHGHRGSVPVAFPSPKVSGNVINPASSSSNGRAGAGAGSAAVSPSNSRPGPSQTESQAPGFAPAQLGKPEFPITNAITPETLRSYFLNSSIDVLLLDVRDEKEYSTGYVGAEYVARGAKINVIWIDPTVLARDGLTSTQLEDAMSLSPQAQQLAFQNRHKYDLVVLYDKRSTTFPKKGEPPTPISRLWSIIGENEFRKTLPRFPAMLIGGFEGWVKFIMARQKASMQQHQLAQQQQSRPYNPKTNGHGPVPLGPKPVGNRTNADLLAKKQSREAPAYHQSSQYARGITENSMTGAHASSASISSLAYAGYDASRPAQSPSLPRTSHASSASISSYNAPSAIAPPPRASIHPGAGARRQSGYLDSQGYSGHTTTSRPSIDYPQPHALAQVPQPPPAVATHSLERQDPRPMPRTVSTRSVDQLAPNYGVRYWRNTKLGLTGLKNLGNTCYMNSTVQCLSATLPFARYFLDGRYKRDINVYNPLGTKGDLAHAFAELLGALWGENYTFLSPITFRKSIINFKSDFAGSEQHDSQEFLSFVMDGLHEDLNRIKTRPKPIEMTPEREAALETLPPQIASDKEWQIYKMRNDSLIVDLFQGQYMNRMECLTCHKTSTVYDSFQWLTLDLPTTKSKVVLPELFDQFVKPEILDGDEKWFCPRCKVNRRASKTLTLVRLPPVLLIQLKRFIPVNGGRFWNKSETPVIFPLTNLDLSRYVPVRQPTGTEDLDDPRTQIGPFKYDLYGVSNHMGTLSSGHYTAFVRSSDQWMFCEDSRVQPAREVDVVSRPAYILFYKRVQAS